MDRKDINKKYGAFPSDENGRYSWCINCGFSDFGPNASYCNICGNKLYNSCSDDDCNHYCEPYARYCEKCGNPSMLLQKELLWPYTKPVPYEFNIMKVFWDDFFREREKELEEIDWYQHALDLASWNKNKRVLTLRSYEKYLPGLQKLEWEFSRFINQMTTFVLTHQESGPAKDK